MKGKKDIYFLIILPLILTLFGIFVLPNEVAIRYSSKGIQYGSKWSLLILPLFSFWVGGFMLLVGKAVENTEQENIVRKITYIPLGIFNLITIVALLGAAFIHEGKTNLQMIDIIVGVAIGAVAIVFAVYASFAAREKGPIISNPYIWLSKEEKEKMDKKAEYRQLAIVFFGLSIGFAMLAIYIVASWRWAFIATWVVMGLVIIYAAGSSIKEAIKK